MIRTILRWVLVVFYFAAGVIHVINPAPFLTIMPTWVPAPHAVVLWTGVAEIMGAIGLAQPFSKPLRQAAGWGLALYALCVWPANINHLLIDLAKPGGGLGMGYHVPRMFAQPAIIWLALWVGECLPLRRRTPE
jgi:uncharacterized membrane protein